MKTVVVDHYSRKMEAMMVLLHAQIRNNHEEMTDKMDIHQEEMDKWKGKMKAQMSSLTSRIDVNQEEIIASINAIHYQMEVMIKCSQEEIEAKT
jgi:hypothetical protein